MLNRLAVDIGGEDLHRVILLQRVQVLLQQDGKRIGLFAGGTASDQTRITSRRFAGKKLGNDLFLQVPEGLRVTEKTGHPDQQIAKKCFHLGWSLLQVVDVLIQRFDLVNGHAPFDAAMDGAWLVLGKIMAGLGPAA